MHAADIITVCRNMYTETNLTSEENRLMIKKASWGANGNIAWTYIMSKFVYSSRQSHVYPSSTSLSSRLPWSLGHVLSAPVLPEAFSGPTEKRLIYFSPPRRAVYHWSRKGWQINLNLDWWEGMLLSGLVWGLHHEVEKPMSINSSRHPQAGDFGSSAIVSRVMLCLGQRGAWYHA